MLLDTTRFLLIKSFKLLDNSASTGYAHLRSRYLTKSSVHIRAVHTSAESSPVCLFFLLIQSFQALLNIGYILTEPSSRNWWRSHDIAHFVLTFTLFEAVWRTHPSRRTCAQTWFVMHKDTIRSYEFSSNPALGLRSPSADNVFLSLVRSTPHNHARLPGVSLSSWTGIGHPNMQMGQVRGIGCIQGMHAFVHSLYAALLTALDL